MGKCAESLHKNPLKLNAASHNKASWSTDIGVFLEHSPSGRSLYYKGPALQKIILVLGGPSHMYYIEILHMCAQLEIYSTWIHTYIQSVRVLKYRNTTI